MAVVTEYPAAGAVEVLAALRASTQTNGVRRSVQSEYVLAELPDANGETERRAVVQVTTYHHGDRKQYATSIQQVETARSAHGPFSVTKFSLFSGVTLKRVPVARHSAKALQAAHEQGLAVLEAALGQANEKVLAQFEIKEQS
ncbi:MAG: hypothetical protein NVS3B1_17810 [Marmoricola sp.]